MKQELDLLRDGAQKLGLSLTPEQLAQFASYREELLAWNQKVNLTAIVDPREVVLKHFLDSLTLFAVCRFVPNLAQPSSEALSDPKLPAAADDRLVFSSSARLVDIGTGAGFPGLALKIAVPSLSILLVESINKKTAFLRHIVDHLALPNVEIVSARAEDLAHLPRYRHQNDLVVARAVAKLAALAELALPFCRTGGAFIAYKGSAAVQETKEAHRALRILGGRLYRIQTVCLTPDLEPRVLAVIRKVAPTPSIYPRRAGLPAKSPL